MIRVVVMVRPGRETCQRASQRVARCRLAEDRAAALRLGHVIERSGELCGYPAKQPFSQKSNELGCDLFRPCTRTASGARTVRHRQLRARRGILVTLTPRRVSGALSGCGPGRGSSRSAFSDSDSSEKRTYTIIEKTDRDELLPGDLRCPRPRRKKGFVRFVVTCPKVFQRACCLRLL